MMLKDKQNLTKRLLLAFSIKKTGQKHSAYLTAQPATQHEIRNQPQTMTSFGMCEKIQILHFSLTKLNNNGETDNIHIDEHTYMHIIHTIYTYVCHCSYIVCVC